MSGYTESLDTAALTAPLGGETPGGVWLRHDRVYDDIKAARDQEPAYLPQGIWARPLKQAEWPTVVTLARDALSARSKDLQLAAWLTEALGHLEGVAGLAGGLGVMRGLVEQVWTHLHPPIDPEDGVEPRTLVLEWCDRHLPTAVQGVNVSRPSTPLADPVSLLTWDEAERREAARSAERETRRGRGREPVEAGEDEPSRDTVMSSVRLTPRGFYTDLIATTDAARDAVSQLCASFDAQCGEHQARLPRLDAMLAHLRGRAGEALALLDTEQTPASDGAAESASSGGPGGGRRESVPAAEKAAAAPADPVAVIGGIGERDQAYRALAALAERLAQIDPHSPAPYLARRAAGLKDQSFADLVMLLADDDRQRQHLFRLLGISDDDRSQEATAHASA
jgi:type VI secretion system ImpA family protein